MQRMREAEGEHRKRSSAAASKFYTQILPQLLSGPRCAFGGKPVAKLFVEAEPDVSPCGDHSARAGCCRLGDELSGHLSPRFCVYI